MSEKIPEGLDRREVLKAAAIGLYVAGTINPAAARALHSFVQQEGDSDGYQPKAFTDHEYATVRHLAAMIVPADEVSGSAVDAGAPEFIDLLASERDELARIFTGGIHWLDNEMRHRGRDSFLEAPRAAQAEILDQLAAVVDGTGELSYESYGATAEYEQFLDYTTRRPSPLQGGARFFGWMRRLAVDAFYSSAIGFADVDYQGNDYLREYRVPQEAIDYAVSRSPFKDE